MLPMYNKREPPHKVLCSGSLSVLVHLFQSLFQVLCDLVRAAGAAEAAQRTIQTGNSVLCLHAGEQLADALQVAVAAADCAQYQ